MTHSMNTPSLDRAAIDAKKAAFRIERFAEPVIAPMPEVARVRQWVGGRVMKSTRKLKSNLDKIAKDGRGGKRPGAGAPKGRTPHNKVVSMTGRAIVDLLRAGRSMAQIAVGFRVTASAVSHALSRELAASDELRAEYDGMTVCECGRPKLPQREKCIRCRQGR